MAVVLLLALITATGGAYAQESTAAQPQPAPKDSSYRRIWKLDWKTSEFTWMWKLDKSANSIRSWRPAQVTVWVPAKYPRKSVIGTNGRRSEYISNSLSLNLTAGINGGVRGLEAGLIANINNGKVLGLQAAGIANVTQGTVGGVQVAGIANVGEKTVTALQVAGIANVSNGNTSGIILSGITNVSNGDMNGILVGGFANVANGSVRGIATSVFANVGGDMGGILLSGFANVSNGDMRGITVSGISNVSNDGMRGIVASGISNVANGDLDGIALSGIANVANGVGRGVQVSGIANVTSGNLYGIQLSGLANVVGDELRGIQIGLINVAKRSKGLQLGAINVVEKNGYIADELSTSEVFQAGYAFKSGKPYLYNIVSVGAQLVGPSGSQPRWGLGWGLGSKVTMGSRVSVSLDAIWHYVNENQLWTRAHFTSLSTLRLTGGWLIGNRWELFAGPTLNWLVSNRVNDDGSIGGRVNPFNGTGTNPYANASSQQWWVGGIIGFRHLK